MGDPWEDSARVEPRAARGRGRLWIPVCLAVVVGGGAAGVFFLWPGESDARDPTKAEVTAARTLREALSPLHARLEQPKPGEWLHSQQETGQTWEQYIAARPQTALGRRRVLYVQPLGEFSAAQRKVLDLSADLLGRFYQLPVKTLPDVGLEIIPKSARRVHPTWGGDQVLSTHILDKVLPPKLPADGMAIIAFTTADLWPGEGWNFVFGQASLANRVGVWSLHRYGDPAKDAEAFRLCLRRTIKTAAHETGHMFSIKHCTAFRCGMNGSNSLDESDRGPLEFCPECLAKICWATGAEPQVRCEQLSEFCRAQGLTEEREFYDRCLAELKRK